MAEAQRGKVVPKRGQPVKSESWMVPFQVLDPSEGLGIP